MRVLNGPHVVAGVIQHEGKPLHQKLSVINSVGVFSAGKDSQKGSVRQRDVKGRAAEEAGTAASGGRGSDTKADTPNIVVTHLADVESDLNPQEPLQKVVRFSPDQSLLLTGGTDGHVRVWEVSVQHV